MTDISVVILWKKKVFTRSRIFKITSIYVLINQYWIGNPVQPVHYMSVFHSLFSVASLSLWLLLYPTVCQYLTFYSLLFLCHYVQCCLLQSFHCLSAPVIVPSVGSVSLSPLLPSTARPVCQYLTLYRLLVLCHYVHGCFLLSVHCLSVPHILPSIGSVSLCPLLTSTVCPLFVSISHGTVCSSCVSMSNATFYSVFTVCQYLSLYLLMLLCHYVHC